MISLSKSFIYSFLPFKKLLVYLSYSNYFFNFYIYRFLSFKSLFDFALFKLDNWEDNFYFYDVNFRIVLYKSWIVLSLSSIIYFDFSSCYLYLICISFIDLHFSNLSFSPPSSFPTSLFKVWTSNSALSALSKASFNFL